jgi:hypothetical protein
MSRMKVWAYVIHESEYIQSSNLEIDVVWAKAPRLFGLSHAHGPRGFKVSCDPNYLGVQRRKQRSLKPQGF